MCVQNNMVWLQISLAKCRKRVCSLSACKRFKGVWSVCMTVWHSYHTNFTRTTQRDRVGEESDDICAKHIFSIIIAFIFQVDLLSEYIQMSMCGWFCVCYNSLFLQALIEGKALQLIRNSSHSKRMFYEIKQTQNHYQKKQTKVLLRSFFFLRLFEAHTHKTTGELVCDLW